MVGKINKKILNKGHTVPNYLYKGKQVRYYGSPSLKVAFLENGNKWIDSGSEVLKPNKNSFDSHPLTVMGVVLTTAGVVVFYDSSFYQKGLVYLRVGMAFFDPEDPTKLMSRNESPLYESKLKTRETISSAKAVQDKEELVLTWKTGLLNKIKVRIPHPYLHLGGKKSLKIKKQLEVNRHPNNPIIEPQAKNQWESKATFNPAALFAGEKVHLLYRSIGYDDVSVLGYVSSDNGFDVTERLKHPVFFNSQQVKKLCDKQNPKKSPISYISGGGGNGGCEDPRLTLIDGIVYLTYTAFDGWGSLRMALSSISIEDFLNKEWNWEKPVMISPPGEIHKNWVLFPEKINGKFAVLHSVNPNVLIDYLDDLDFKGEDRHIEGFFSSLKNKGRWDSWVRGAGPPPIKTDKGWLLIYHAMDVYNDPNRYKMGAMLLDLDDPQKIIARSKEPILEPDESYENDGWKAGVLYCCGAVVKEGQLLIYYGGADTVSCVAETNLDEFINKLVKTGKPKVEIIKKKVKKK